AADRLAARFWPGPLTLIVARRPELPSALGSEPTVGVRLPDHDLARWLLREAGPLAVTSANPTGGANSLTAEDVRKTLSPGPDLVVDGGPAPGGVPSTVVDCVAEPPRLLRPGPIGVEDLRRLIPNLVTGDREQ
ncbi:MAG: L-threonylcarbamoyladenylate synthase, partial [Gemmatimonadales bacterium]